MPDSRKILFLIFLIISCSVSLKAQMIADTIKIDEILIYFEKELSEAGLTIYKFDPDKNIEEGSYSLSDLLKNSGIITIREYGSGNLSTASIRGAGASHTKVSWNGLNINSPLTGQVDFSIIPVEFIDNIFIFPGNGGIQENAGAIGGNIQLNNSLSKDEGFNFNISQVISSFNTYRSFLKTEFNSKKWHFVNRVSTDKSNNNFPYINTATLPNERSFQKNAMSRSFNFMQEIYYEGDNNNISFNIWNSNNNRQIPALMSYEGTNHEEYQKDKKTLISLKWERKNNKSKIIIQGGYIYDLIHYELSHFSNEGIITSNESDGFSNSLFQKTEYSFRPNESLKIELSADITQNFADYKNLIYGTNFLCNRNEVSFYSGIHKKSGKKLITYLLLRNSLFDGNHSPLSPVVGFNFILSKKYGISIKGNLGSNYRYPSLNDLYFIPGGNPDLKPEKSKTFELGTIFKNSFRSTEYEFNLTSFYTLVDDWILWKPTQFSYWQPENIESVRSKGIETIFNISGKFSKIDYKFSGVYSFTKTNNLSSGNPENSSQLIYIPCNKGNLILNAKYKGSTISYSILYTGIRNTGIGSSSINYLPAYLLHDLSISQSIPYKKNNFNVTFIIKNIFNTSYQNIRYRATPGINFLLKLSYEI